MHETRIESHIEDTKQDKTLYSVTKTYHIPKMLVHSLNQKMYEL